MRLGLARMGKADKGKDFSLARLSKVRLCTAKRSKALKGKDFSKGKSNQPKRGIMKTITVKIAGTTPMLCNRFTDEAAMSSSAGTRSATVGGRGTPREQAEKKLYISEATGEPMIPSPNLFRCLIDGGKFFKAGKSKVTTLKSSLIPACVSIEELEIPIQSVDPWDVDTRAVRIPSTGGRILAHRPCFHSWKLSFTLELDEEVLDVRLLREIVDAAGKRIGLGDFRPDCKGPFGKFVVEQWDEVKN